jgi:hypothetical protein
MCIETYERQLALVEVYMRLAEAEQEIAQGDLCWMEKKFLKS